MNSATPPVSDSAPTPRPTPIVGDQATVISSRAPLPAHSNSDSAHRILEGRIMPGDHLGHFELLGYVGGGGMGRVFRASDTRLARIVALKVLSPEQAADPETVQRFQNEAQSAARLDHDNIARVHYVGEDRGIHFIAFEFVEGVNIRVLVEQRGPLPLAEAVSYTLQVAEALSHADARNVVHRDIKPSNVIITPDGRAKLIDMGLARLRQLDSAAADLTASGVTLGTFDYISPEQARDPRNADTRSDIYSLGCTFFFMLTGRPPFLEGTVLQKLLQHQSEEPPDVAQFRPDLPEEANAILQKMLAKSPEDRYGNAGELAVDLLAISDRLGLQPLMPGNRSWPVLVEAPPSFWRRHLPWIGAIATFLLIVLALQAFWTFTASRSDGPKTPYLIENLSPSVTPTRDDAAPRGAASSTEKGSPRLKEGTAERAENKHSGMPGNQGDSAISTHVGDAIRGRASLGGTASDPSVPSLRSTAEQYFHGRPLDGPSPIGYPVIPSGSDIFPLDAAKFSAGPLRIPGASVPNSASLRGDSSSQIDLDATPTELAAKHGGVLVVGDQIGGENHFASLAAASAAAHNGDVIELRYNGHREETPLSLTNLRLTIRAGRGYSPSLVFRPQEADPVRSPRGMFTLRSGRLVLANVSLEMIVPRDIPAESWSLLEIHGYQAVRFERCTLTIDNAGAKGAAYHADVAFVRVLPLSIGESAVSAASPDSAPPTIELIDSVARGEAVFLRAVDLQPVALNWTNGLLTTSESLLFASGGTRQPKAIDRVSVSLRHVTARAGAGLLRLAATSAAPLQLPLELNCADNLFTGQAGVPFLQQEGVDAAENQRQLVSWIGDLNLYDSIDVFWSVGRLGSMMPATRMDFGGWTAYWGPSLENQPMLSRLEWKRRPDPDYPAHLQIPADYELSSEHGENPALGRASDGFNVGMQADRLPISSPPSL
jgi:eukaryotic-like serine/threonine-protein kinase